MVQIWLNGALHRYRHIGVCILKIQAKVQCNVFTKGNKGGIEELSTHRLWMCHLIKFTLALAPRTSFLYAALLDEHKGNSN